jgi:flagellar basal-body rod protein FlgF
MDALTVAAASAMRARMESLEMLANNLANQTSPGFKADREFYSLYVAPEAMAGAGGNQLLAPVIERHYTDFSQGSFVETGNALDLALSGQGFLVVQGPAGQLYTRNGHLRLSEEGRLETREGYPLVDRENRPIVLDPAIPFEVSRSGEIRQGGEAVNHLRLATFADPANLAKREGTYFQWNGLAGEVRPAPALEVHQGRLEAANFSPAETAVRLIQIMRQFETMQKAIQIGSEMGRRLEDVARPGS